MKKKKVRPLGGIYWRLDDSTCDYVKKRIFYFFLKLFKRLKGYEECDWESDVNFSMHCIKGRIYDLDNCDDDGNIYEADEDDYCVVCNETGFVRKER